MNNNIESLFLLLRVGLDTGQGTTFDMVQWEPLCQIAKIHGVTAIIAEALTKLINEGCELKGLELSLKQRVAFEALGIENNYLRLWNGAKNLAELYQQNGIRTIGLKGFVTSNFYPKPHQRYFCDFDCFLSDFEKGNELVREKGVKVEGSYKHSTFDYQGVHVENHQFCTHFRGNRKSRDFEEILEAVMRDDDAQYLGDSFIEKPSPLFNALFLTYHARSHFFDERVSLRQIIDWAMLMKFYGHEQVDWDTFADICERFGLLSFAQTMSRLANKVCCVEIPFVCPKDNKLDSILLENVFSMDQEHVEYGTGMRARMQILRNKYKQRWKYKYFSNESFASSLSHQVWGYINGSELKRNIGSKF